MAAHSADSVLTARLGRAAPCGMICALQVTEYRRESRVETRIVRSQLESWIMGVSSGQDFGRRRTAMPSEASARGWRSLSKWQRVTLAILGALLVAGFVVNPLQSALTVGGILLLAVVGYLRKRELRRRSG